MNDVPEELKIDSKYLPPKGSSICRDLFYAYKMAELMPTGNENLDNNFLS
jgi:hypothetical protein